MLNTLGERVVFSYIMKIQYICHSHRVGYVNNNEMYRNICVIAMLAKFVTSQPESYEQHMLTMCFVCHILTF